MSNAPVVLVHADAQTVAVAAAERFIRKAVQIIEDFGELHIVLTGGTVGIATLRAVADSTSCDRIRWDRVQVWWGDERWVPADSPERNERQAREALLDRVPVVAANVHPMPASDSGLTLDEAAAAYEAELRAHASVGSELPPFDVLFLGVGPDGHVASLFPGQESLQVRDRLVVPVRNAPKPPPERLSLTYLAINSAARVIIVLAGAEKTAPLGLALAGASKDEVPLAGVIGRRRTLFHVDAAAASQVPASLIQREAYWTQADDTTD